ncbi:DUF2877 domain-containing protein [Silvimonas iriomotensis]|uniref:DUF2877 domain-containing protein n=1 Tax=Silvimonas iriomotensis TaxID=449662 RepID=A0ABQ2PCL0_9NEIS|nr:DUF2877 domain-containing protein [Silvimonas iriomotensis]GGP23141.1 hypothetical protein GCM10010970_31410 [Silvimonas iriomotensis]
MLHAQAVGYLLRSALATSPRHRVHSCFAQVLNLVDDAGNLLTLLPAHAPMQPTAIQLALPWGWDWRQHAQPDQSVSVTPGLIYCEAWAARLEYASTWHPRHVDGKAAIPPAAPAWLAAVAQQEQALRAGKALTLPGYAPLDSAQVFGLIGSGAGLTPDGDDYLVGYLGAWQLAPRPSGIERVVLNNLDRTSAISAHYLRLAATQHFSQPIDQLLCALQSGATQNAIAMAARKITAMGATSGLSTLNGFLHGLIAQAESAPRISPAMEGTILA